MSPIIAEMKERKISHELFVTTQNESALDAAMRRNKVSVKVKKIIVDNMNCGISGLISNSVIELHRTFKRYRPKFVFVYGDSTSALAGAIAAFNMKISVGHIESGTRTYDIRGPYPEEANRQLIARIANMHFCPTVADSENVVNEGLNSGCVSIVTGSIKSTSKIKSSRAAKEIVEYLVAVQKACA
jgi:UDP-N-acetylglucosamine 2-epimerase (non-hydrolysing)